MADDTMVERVAKALEGNPWEVLSDKGRSRRMTLARYVIEAMREPTQKMAEAIAGVPYRSDGQYSRNVWRAMIDAALGETPDTPE